MNTSMFFFLIFFSFCIVLDLVCLFKAIFLIFLMNFAFDFIVVCLYIACLLRLRDFFAGNSFVLFAQYIKIRVKAKILSLYS